MDSLPMQQAALQQLAAIPGVVGSMVFDREGEVVAAEFPAVFEDTGLRQLGTRLASDAYFQEWLVGDQALMDLRYADGSVVIRPVEETWLMVVCTPQANHQLLAMSLTQVARRLRLSGAGPARPAAVAPAAPARPEPAPPLRLARLKALVSAELGAQAAQALEILAAAGTSTEALLAAAGDIEKLTRLFISRRKADEIGAKLRGVIGA